MKYSWAALAFVATLAACADTVTIRSGDGISLTYRCEDVATLAIDSERAQLLQSTARNLINVAARRAEGGWAHRIEALVDGEVRPLERMVVLYMCDTGARPSHHDEAEFPDSSSRAPDFQLPVAFAPAGFEAGTVSLESHRGEYVLLDFWASWCVPCLGKQAFVADLATQFRDRGLNVYAILVGDRRAAAETWVREHGKLAYPFLDDVSEAASEAYGVIGIPRMFLIGPDGAVLSHCFGCATGRMAADSLGEWIDGLLSRMRAGTRSN